MTKMFFSTLLIILSFFMFFLNHPLSMGLMILMQTLLTCILSGLIIKTYWFSYVLFLTFLGGLLVLFIYVSSVASNELFMFSFKMKMFFFSFILISLFLSLLFSYNLNWMNFINNSDMDNFFNNYLFFNNENKINLTKLYNNQTFLLMIMLIIYLFITLVAVVKITNIFFGPLRTFI
uniref:NADH-ubiquinone oxidoreductase chain 6 n=1 Tax=Phthorimaea operculella TaxID=192464 RepID=A0A899IK24_PHTOP|nr:NADH dehydrogenase subunit 6 [Phthorimaea operculella]QRN71780.1 NADH dehydrogenase subunit 6 [Phthorimaea operculella]QSL98468.1 NADH dehydrogenase subunit 6 [Phthorimaea operculella]